MAQVKLGLVLGVIYLSRSFHGSGKACTSASVHVSIRKGASH